MQMAVTSIFTKTLASLFPVPRAPDFLASHFDIDTSSSMGTSLNERIGTELGKYQRWLGPVALKLQRALEPSEGRVKPAPLSVVFFLNPPCVHLYPSYSQVAVPLLLLLEINPSELRP